MTDRREWPNDAVALALAVAVLAVGGALYWRHLEARTTLTRREMQSVRIVEPITVPIATTETELVTITDANGVQQGTVSRPSTVWEHRTLITTDKARFAVAGAWGVIPGEAVEVGTYQDGSQMVCREPSGECTPVLPR